MFHNRVFSEQQEWITKDRWKQELSGGQIGEDFGTLR
jgi:hypothetical protein